MIGVKLYVVLYLICLRVIVLLLVVLLCLILRWFDSELKIVLLFMIVYRVLV